MEYLIVTLRIISIMALALFLILKTGRRSIGELPVFDFIVIIVLGSVIGADIADPEIQHLPTAYAVVLLLLLQYVFSKYIIKNRKIFKKVSFEPVMIIKNGVFIKNNMLKINYSIDNILMMLREKDVFDISEVEYAIIEQTGKISVLKKSQNMPVTPKDLKIDTDYTGLSTPLIIEGIIQVNNLKQLNLDKIWLYEQLRKNNVININDVFFATLNTKGEFYISIDR